MSTLQDGFSEDKVRKVDNKSEEAQKNRVKMWVTFSLREGAMKIN